MYQIPGTLQLKAGQALIGLGSRDAIISGAKTVSASQQGSYWVITGQSSLGQSAFTGLPAQCRPAGGGDPKGMCVYRDQVFLDDVSLWQVGSLGELSSGEFYWDYAANKIYLADDPTGEKLEVSVSTGGISGGWDVRLENLVVEKFGNPIQGGAISANHWTIDDVEVRLNHGGGIHMGPYTVVRDSYIHHNGQIGVHGGQALCAAAKGLVLQNTELAYNNAAGYDWSWEGGATKWTFTDGLIVRGNYIHDNYGSGLWTDIVNIDTLFANNLVEDNYASGIVDELGFGAVIRDNVVRRNGLHHPVPGDVWSAGILIDQSRDAEVYGNTVQDNGAGITAVQEPAGGDGCGLGEPEVRNLNVHDNTIVQPTGIAAGLRLLNEPDQSYYTTGNNRWEGNTYSLGSLSGSPFFWQNAKITASSWRAYGHDEPSGDFSQIA